MFNTERGSVIETVMRYCLWSLERVEIETTIRLGNYYNTFV